jgi:two-component system cell cycle sensor histidine kinase/response regulator CckA
MRPGAHSLGRGPRPAADPGPLLLSEAREALRSSESRLATLLEHSLDGIALFAEDTTLLYGSPSLTRLLGHRVADVEGRPGLDLVHPDDREALRGGLARLLEKPEPIRRATYRLRHADGGWRWIEAIAQNRLADRSVRAIVVNFRDVTDEREARRHLERLTRLYALLSRANEAIARLRPPEKLYQAVCRIAVIEGGFRLAWIGMPAADGTVRPAASYGPEAGYLENIRISTRNEREGFGPVGLALRRGQAYVCPDIAADPAMAPWRERALSRGLRSIASFPIHTGDRQVGALALYGQGVGDFDAETTRLLSRLAEGLSFASESWTAELQRRRAESALEEQRQRLRQARKLEAIGRLAGGVAHDFNNLIAVILGYTESLARDASPSQCGKLDQIRRAAERGAQLTHHLLAFGRRQVLHPRPLDLAASVRDAEPMLRGLLGSGVSLSVAAETGGARVLADPLQIEQVLLNLASNARDAMPGGGTLEIRVEQVELLEDEARGWPWARPGAWLRLGVRDGGHGMDAETRSRIFEPFFTTKQPGQGAGLGLASVHGIVEQSGGGIVVESAPGAGSRFDVYLPRMQPAEATPVTPAERGAAPPAHRSTILLVEDEQPLRELMRADLTAAGYSVLDAHSGDQALELLARPDVAIDLLLTDVVMTGLSGPELARSASRLRPELPALLMSGYGFEELQRHGLLETTPNLLSKPFSEAALLDAVRGALAPR